MPKNKGKGGKNRRRGKNEGDEKRELTVKEDGQEYAQVVKMLGNGMLVREESVRIVRCSHVGPRPIGSRLFRWEDAPLPHSW